MVGIELMPPPSGRMGDGSELRELEIEIVQGPRGLQLPGAEPNAR